VHSINKHFKLPPAKLINILSFIILSYFFLKHNKKARLFKKIIYKKTLIEIFCLKIVVKTLKI